MRAFIVILLIQLSFVHCKKKEESIEPKIQEEVQQKQQGNPLEVNAYEMVELGSDQGYLLDIRYATTNNFTDQVIYDCPKCFLHKSLVEELNKAQKIFKEEYGLRIKLFDCYRPRPAQKRLWFIVPDPRYVSDPAKGSMHNRGLAVDLTLVDDNGKELDMGTDFDFFGEEAHTDNLNLPKNVLANRKILSETLALFNIRGIRTEWWHFSLRTENVPLSDWEWSCD